MPGGNTRLAVFQAPYPIFVKSAKGTVVTDVDGIARTDFINNQSTLIHGHGFGPVIEAVQRQLELGTCFSGPTEAEIVLAETLQQRSPAFQRTRFMNSGTEAVMMAVKAARAFTGRHKIAKCEGAYHGTYDFVEASRGSTPATWGDASRPSSVPYAKATPQAVMEQTVVIPFNNIEVALSILDREKDALAAVIVEPVANRPGMLPAQQAYLKALRQFTEANRVLLVFDEIISLRLGLGGAQQDYGIVSDLTTLGKSIGGGFPIGAVTGRAEVMAVFDPSRGSPVVPHTGTFNANPVSMVAGAAALQHFDGAAIAKLNAKGDMLREAMNEVLRKKGNEGQVSGKGSLFRLHLRGGALTDYRSAYPSKEETGHLASIHRHLVNSGFLLSVNCSGNISTALSDADIEGFIDAFRAALDNTQSVDAAGRSAR
jgi:glutamate-1-semialdehyde 2,1-aminomutase